MAEAIEVHVAHKVDLGSFHSIQCIDKPCNILISPDDWRIHRALEELDEKCDSGARHELHHNGKVEHGR